MSDQHKPLTAAEIDDAKKYSAWLHSMAEKHGKGGVLNADGRSLGRAGDSIDRLLSLLTPPTDAALREAVERVRAYTRVAFIDADVFMDIHFLLRAVQAPRLTGDDGVSLIAAERARQVAVEGWTPKHDAHHKCDELPSAAAYYCAPGARWFIEQMWPPQWMKKFAKRESTPVPSVRDLVKAGALIAAEIDRRRAAFPGLFGKEG